MSKLATKARGKLPAKDFGEPGARKFPMPDASHAADAKSRATQQVNKGLLAPSTAKKIDAKANKVIAGKKGK